MAGPALTLAVSDPPIDINRASASELRYALPGIGEKVAMRIVAYREENGPFENANDLARVPGIDEKWISIMSNRISVTPANSGYRRSAPAAVSDGSLPTHRFSIDFDAFPGSFAPSLDSLLPRGPVEPHLGVSLTPTLRPSRGDVGGSILSAAPPARTTRSPNVKAAVEQVVHPADTHFRIPVSLSWRVWITLGALGILSALGGAIAAVCSQDDGRRGQTELDVMGTSQPVEK
jgi:competence protein ComEA